MKPAVVLVVILIISLVRATKDDDDWRAFKEKFGKKHKPAEEAARKRNFIATQRAIERHNSAGKSWRAGHNHFSDLTDKEKEEYLGGVPFLPKEGENIAPSAGEEVPVVELIDQSSPETRQLPTSLDYRNDTCMQPIKNQGQCGSCWAFGAVNTLEFSRCKAASTRIGLSEQQLIDCDKSNMACNGGSFYKAWYYLLGGAMSSTYSYTSGTTKLAGTCAFDRTKVAAYTGTFGRVNIVGSTATPNATAGMIYLKTYGPLATNMRVISSLYSYTSGVYDDPACNTNVNFLSTNHIVTVVGYGTTSTGIPYWIVRNTWGTGWGQSGYFFVRRGNDRCFIESWLSYVKAL